MPHYLQTAERQEQGNSCTSTTVRLPLLLGNFLELRLKRLCIAQPSCWLQPPLFPRRLLTLLKFLPAPVCLSTPCKSHTALSLPPHPDKVLLMPSLSIAGPAIFVALRSFVLLHLKPPSLPGPDDQRASLWGKTDFT